MQRSSTYSPVIGADLVVERQEIGRDLPRNEVALADNGRPLGFDVGELVANARRNLLTLSAESIALSGELGHRSPGPLHPLHDLQLDVLEVGLPPHQVLQLRGDRLQLLWVTHGAGIEEFLIASTTLTHLLDVLLRLGLVGLQITGDGLGSDDLVAQSRQARIDVGEDGRVGQVRRLVGQLRQSGVLLLQVKKTQLEGGIGVQGWLPRCMVHGSVAIADTWTSTVVPRAARSPSSAVAATGSQGHSLAQCATSMSAQPPSTRWS